MPETPSDSPTPLRLAVLISGGGTTLVNLHQEIAEGRLPAEIGLVIANRPCGGVERAHERSLPVEVIRSKEVDLETFSGQVFQRCREAQVDLVVLGGFLARLLIPVDFERRVINIHPSLIPAFCGQGMYGERVHRAVLDRGCKVSGCTVHFCDNEYDHGPIILQRTVTVEDDDTPKTLAARVFEEECYAYPEAIRLIADGRILIEGARVRLRDARST
ncbi:Phosphoribosylglycinamide formyltransferase [Durusdinium trenchii]|uniref:phosphoribosylglycinamide formyltransferase 1 n=1 Tax=Durusdinium trenchii TaxID=1381693 RepID=A0ABP0JJZ6_9DINO